ncbi:hypothetical protein J7413_20210 [Shimia sp. R10_1]|uniref:hypothetical protein n=1 Tax=Shimia sp. R10_1 TaxID=2821095 RepID=UPI001ADAA153|nr:hypothetical protein [Shimia sp. R10_1]MBO9475864.1 hypothetical protein [Shimia sp. R10_1]
MHVDLIHAAVIVVALVLTNIVLKATGVVGDDDTHRWSWKRFLAYFVVVAVINIVWPM